MPIFRFKHQASWQHTTEWFGVEPGTGAWITLQPSWSMIVVAQKSWRHTLQYKECKSRPNEPWSLVSRFKVAMLMGLGHKNNNNEITLQFELGWCCMKNIILIYSWFWLPWATVGSSWSPMGRAADRLLVPRFNQMKDEHGGPPWATPSSTTRSAICTKRKNPCLGQSQKLNHIFNV